MLMLLPALHALLRGEMHVAFSFASSGLLGLAAVAGIGLAISSRVAGREPTDAQNLAALLLTYVLLPLYLALPFFEGVRNTSFLNAYVEMVSQPDDHGGDDVRRARSHRRQPAPVARHRRLGGRAAHLGVGLGDPRADEPRRLRGHGARRAGAGRRGARPVPARAPRAAAGAGRAHAHAGLCRADAGVVGDADARRGAAPRGADPCHGHALDQRRLARGRGAERGLGARGRDRDLRLHDLCAVAAHILVGHRADGAARASSTTRSSGSGS